jgi:hypothetical protein
LTDEEDMKTRTLFDKCVGRVFPIYEIDETDGMLFIGIEVGHVVGCETYEHTIYIEPEYVEVAPPPTPSTEPESK